MTQLRPSVARLFHMAILVCAQDRTVQYDRFKHNIHITPCIMIHVMYGLRPASVGHHAYKDCATRDVRWRASRFCIAQRKRAAIARPRDCPRSSARPRGEGGGGGKRVVVSTTGAAAARACDSGGSFKLLTHVDAHTHIHTSCIL